MVTYTGAMMDDLLVVGRMVTLPNFVAKTEVNYGPILLNITSLIV